MQNSSTLEKNKEIDLIGIFLIFWNYKFFIILISVLGIILGGIKALDSPKIYTSVAVFKLAPDKNTNNSSGGELGAILSLAGNSKNSVRITDDQIKGRVFVKKLDKKLKFRNDPYFNRYNPNAVDPYWKATIKQFVGWQKPELDKEEMVWQSVSSAFARNVKIVSKSSADIVQIFVTHKNSVRAANIANHIMQTIMDGMHEKKVNEQDQQLEYLSLALARSLFDLESKQTQLKNFVLKNNALPLETFTAGSIELDNLREKLKKTTELYNSVEKTLFLVQKKTITEKDYLLLRKEFPLVDQVEFRRILGGSEIVSYWNWPSEVSLKGVISTLKERINRLNIQIQSTQNEAERFGKNLETYTALEREATIAEATYTVLIEQTKAQSMIAGYSPERSEVYDYAVPSSTPSSPNRKLVMVLGAMLGFFIGSTIAFIHSSYRNVHYTKKSLILGSKAKFTASIKTLLPLRKKSFEQKQILLNKKPYIMLRDLVLEIHKNGSRNLVITSSRAKLTGIDMALILAGYMQKETIKVAILDLSKKQNYKNINKENIIETFIVSEKFQNVSILSPNSTYDAMSQKDFIENIKLLTSTFDMVITCADDYDAMSLLRASQNQNFFHITLARVKHTKLDVLPKMHNLLPIQGLLHD
jgi:uncharacterized protein involved in exopolysaccharide biosynthesis/aspartate carbamoyltransferase regulatory subunit